MDTITGSLLIPLLQLVGLLWVLFSTLFFSFFFFYCAYIGLLVLLRPGKILIRSESESDKAAVVIKTIPVTWGKKEARRVIDISV